MLVNVCPDDIYWTTEHFVTKPSMVIMQHHKPNCHAEKLFHCVQCQGHSEGSYYQNMTISVVSSKLLVCLQPYLIYSTGVFCRKIESLCSRSRSQWMFKMSVNVCSVDIFWITEHFVTKLGTVMQHHEPECRAEFVVVVAVFNVKVTARAHMIKIWSSTIFLELLNPWLPNLVWWYIIISQSVLLKRKDCCIQGQGHSEGSKC